MTADDDIFMRLLLVEDDSLDRAALLRALRHRHQAFYINEANGVCDASLLLQTHTYDAVLVEYELHDGDAADILSLVNTMPYHRPAVIILGDNDDDSLAGQCIQSGAQAYLIKGEIKPCTLSSIIVQARQHAEQLEVLRRQAEQLRSQAEHDALTGLYNRHVFDEHLAACLAHGERYGRSFAVMMIDLDRFKLVNDTWGHCTGDTLLQQVARRICSVTRDSDRVCRIGGDEFAILLPEINHGEQPAMLARRLAALLEEPLQADGQEVIVGASIGVAIYPDHGNTAEHLLRHADGTMYQHKHRLENPSPPPADHGYSSRPV